MMSRLRRLLLGPGVLVVIAGLGEGHDALADALPFPGYKPPPCPAGAEWQSGGAGHRYCAAIRCDDATPCRDAAVCRATDLCLQSRMVAIGNVEEVVARDGANCPAQARASTERVCVAAAPAPGPPGQRPSSGCGCRYSPEEGGPWSMLGLLIFGAGRRRRRR